jgi:hypothetical protein
MWREDDTLIATSDGPWPDEKKQPPRSLKHLTTDSLSPCFQANKVGFSHTEVNKPEPTL